jgi:hypothetical protein
MAEDGWTQDVCQEEPGFACLLINSLEHLGITERPRYYSREYEQLGTLRCRVVLSIARSNRYPNIEPVTPRCLSRLNKVISGLIIVIRS